MIVLAALILAAFCPCVFAAVPEAAQLFQDGRVAHEREDYEAALQAFQAAARAGLSGPAVHFNIGVAAFHLGRYERAEQAFLEVARTHAMAALAHYNLGLVSQRRGDERAALRWFELAASETKDERLRSLAEAQLAAFRPPPQRNWLGYGSFAAGYDDNVALTSGADVLGVSDGADNFAELQLALSGPLAQPWGFDAGAVWLDYQGLDSFDQLLAHGGAHYRFDAGVWSNEASMQLTHSMLDGDGFENAVALALQAARDLAADWRLRARYRFTDAEGLNEFAGLSGRRHELGVRLGWIDPRWDVRVEYRFESSDHDNAALSASRHQVGLQALRQIDHFWSIEFEAALRRSRYDLDAAGEEDRAALAVGITRAFGERWRLLLLYTYADNQAALPEFDYERSRISAVLQALL